MKGADIHNRDIPLEDTWIDVLRKAMRGLALSEAELENRSGLNGAKIAALMASDSPDPEDLARLATALGLASGPLLSLARGAYHPGEIALPQGMTSFMSPWSDFQVRSCLLWDADTREAAAFDTGSDASEMMKFLSDHGLFLRQIFLTHGHGDHVFDLERLMENTKATAWIGEREEVPGAESFEAGGEFFLGALRIETRSTWGHAKGGITYVIHGLERPVAIVGDALFAGSMGGPMISYKACLESNRKEIFSLPANTLLCPGHGPLTTVALERKHNPFFAGYY